MFYIFKVRNQSVIYIRLGLYTCSRKCMVSFSENMFREVCFLYVESHVVLNFKCMILINGVGDLSQIHVRNLNF